MRGGWALKSFNIFFDYWVGSFASSVRTGKCMAGWTQVADQGYHGGHPPSMGDITEEKNKISAFVKALLGHHTGMDEDLHHFFTANLLRHWSQFISILRDEPRGKYEDSKLEIHPFVFKIRLACQTVDVSEELFDAWCVEVRSGFFSKNMMSLPLKMCKDIPGTVIDARSFVQIAKANNDQ